MNPENNNDSCNNEKCSFITISTSELSAITKRMDQLEESVEKQQGRIITLERENQRINTLEREIQVFTLERENQMLKTELKRRKARYWSSVEKIPILNMDQFGCSLLWKNRHLNKSAFKNWNDEINQYFRSEGCPEQDEETNESSGNEH